MNKKVVNVLTAVSAVFIIGQASVATVAQAATTDQSEVTESKSTTITLEDGSKATVKFNDDSRMSGTINYEGQTKKYQIKLEDSQCKFYLDNNLIYSLREDGSLISPFVNFSYANGKANFTHNGRKYYYLTTEKYNTYTGQKWINIAKDIIGFIPVIGTVANAVQLVKDLFSQDGQEPKTRWYTVKEYCTKGYQYYAWKTYTYSDSARKHLISVKWTYQQVL